MVLKSIIDMKHRLSVVFMLLFFPALMYAQQIIFSEPYREDSQNMNFEILGKMNGNILIFKDVRWHYAVNVFDDSMVLKEKVELDFMPGKTFNVDCIAYPDYFFLVYQFQKKGIIYCMGVKMGPDGNKLNEPVELDTTQVGVLGDNKIYSTIYSEDKKKIILFKIQQKDDRANFVIKLYDNQLQPLHQSRLSMDYDDRRNSFGDFFADNEGNFVFANTERKNTRDNPSAFYLVTKGANADSFSFKKVPLEKAWVDEVKLKVDNVNKRYLINSFYYKERSGNIEGMYNFIWDAAGDSSYASVFSEFNEELKAVAKSSGQSKNAFNDFFIRSIVLKKDGSYILTAEDYSSQSTGMNPWNRYDYLYGSPFYSPYNYNYYSYNPSYYGYYRPYSSFRNQGVRYYYDNILILSISKKGIPDWTNVIHKQQYSDDNDNYLSYFLFNTSGEIHLLFNDISKRNKLLADNIVTADGNTRRSPTMKTYEKGYEFMPRYAKQVGARQVIIPATYRNQICFAKVDF